MDNSTLPVPDLLDPAFSADPYPAFDELRKNDPVHWSEGWSGWILTRYGDVAAALKDPRLSLEGGVAAMFDRLDPALKTRLEPLRRHVSQWLGNLGAEEHRCLRLVMQKGFTAESVHQAVRLTQSATENLLAPVKRTGRMDLVTDLAYPLPATVIAAILGTPQQDRGRFERWSKSLTRFIAFAFVQPEVMIEAQQTIAEMTGYLRARIASGAPTGLMAQMLAPTGDEQASADLEAILANCVLLLFAGHETTTILIGNAALALLDHPGLICELKNHPKLLDAVVEEVLRFDSPVQMIRRVALDSIEIGGKTIRRGDMVWLHLGAANRDPDAFPNPAKLDIHRAGNRHVAFGAGAHYCLGARLSVMEARVALSHLLTLPDLRLEDRSLVKWHTNPTARSLTALPVIWTRPETDAL
jgi:cytochrome P450